ncbi:DUF3243 family protein [Halobacillus litoralis]|nr:DUF3243 family protein [Halobacillus litoralis]
MLNELWYAANEEDRHHIANVLVKLTDETNQ